MSALTDQRVEAVANLNAEIQQRTSPADVVDFAVDIAQNPGDAVNAVTAIGGAAVGSMNPLNALSGVVGDIAKLVFGVISELLVGLVLVGGGVGLVLLAAKRLADTSGATPQILKGGT